jgi:hypothetical protein
MKVIQNKGSDFDICMSLLRTLSSNPSTREKLRADGVLDTAIPYVRLLGANSEDRDQRSGFRAFSIVARLAGNDEYAFILFFNVV